MEEIIEKFAKEITGKLEFPKKYSNHFGRDALKIFQQINQKMYCSFHIKFQEYSIVPCINGVVLHKIFFQSIVVIEKSDEID